MKMGNKIYFGVGIGRGIEVGWGKELTNQKRYGKIIKNERR